MKHFILLLFFYSSLLDCEAQIAKCKFFLLTYEIDGHGKWLDFVNDSVCVYSVGSVSWGTNSDTLNYKIEKGTVVVFSKDSSDVLLKLAIDKVSNRKHKKVRTRYAEGRQNYYQTNGKAVGKIYVLKPVVIDQN